MKKCIIFSIIFLCFTFVSNVMAQTAVTSEERVTTPPVAEEKIKLEVKNTKKHKKVEKKTNQKHAKENYKLSKKRVKTAGTGTFGANGYDGNAKYSSNSQKKHMKAKKQ